MAAALPFIALAGAAIGAVGAVRQGNAAKAAADYNAEVSDQRATVVRSQATVQQEALRKRARDVIGQQLAAVSESGTSLSGSNLDKLSESLYNQELDSMNIRYESELNARGLEGQAQLDRFQGQEAKSAGYISAASSLAKGASSYKNAGGSLPGGGG